MWKTLSLSVQLHWLHINRKQWQWLNFDLWHEMLWKENFCLTWNMTNKKAKNKDCTWIVEVMQTTAAKTDSFLDLFENRLQTKIIFSCRFICNRILCKVWIFAYLSEFISKLNKIEILQSNLNESIRKFISMRMTFDRIHIERSTYDSNRKISILLLSSMLVSAAYDKW